MTTKKSYEMPKVEKLELSFDTVWKKKCDFADQNMGCVPGELKYK